MFCIWSLTVFRKPPQNLSTVGGFPLCRQVAIPPGQNRRHVAYFEWERFARLFTIDDDEVLQAFTVGIGLWSSGLDEERHGVVILTHLILHAAETSLGTDTHGVAEREMQWGKTTLRLRSFNPYSWFARWLCPVAVKKLKVVMRPVRPWKYCRQSAGGLKHQSELLFGGNSQHTWSRPASASGRDLRKLNVPHPDSGVALEI